MQMKSNGVLLFLNLSKRQFNDKYIMKTCITLFLQVIIIKCSLFAHFIVAKHLIKQIIQYY